MPIVPDTKDWTWVIRHPCPECRFNARDYADADIADAILASVRSWAPVLARPDVRARPTDSTWSPLEYAAHVRDVLRVYDARVRLMLAEDDPLYPNWDQDETAVSERYNEQDPGVVAIQLADAASALAARFADIQGSADWSRPGRRNDGAGFTVSSISRYLLHDLEHHAWDVG